MSSLSKTQRVLPVFGSLPWLTWQKLHLTPSETEMKFISGKSCESGSPLSTLMFLRVCSTGLSPCGCAWGAALDTRAERPATKTHANRASPAHTTTLIKRSFVISAGESFPKFDRPTSGCRRRGDYLHDRSNG